jgi:hypothetical protein
MQGRRTAARRVLARGGIVALAVVLAWAAPGSRARAEEAPPEVRRAFAIAAELPAPTEALGFVFQGQGRRADGTEVELTLRIEPFDDDGLKVWKVSEIWSAKAAQGTARRIVESILAPDLTPIRGSVSGGGAGAPTRADWLGGEKTLALQFRAKDRRVLRTAWFAGQPVVEVGAFALLARLLPATAQPFSVDFLAPSWTRLEGAAPKFAGATVVTGKGPTMEIRSGDAPEPTVLTTRAVAAMAGQADTTPFFHMVLDTATGLPVMVTVNGTAYAGDSRPR